MRIGACGTILLIFSVALSGCARDVVLKPAVITFNKDARATVDEARKQYTGTIERLNDQTADFLALHPECGLLTDIPSRRANMKPDQIKAGDPYCLTEAEKDAMADGWDTEKLFIADESTFKVQYSALNLLLDYVTFLAKYSDEPDLVAEAEIQSTVDALKGFGQGVSDLKVAAAKKKAAGEGELEEFQDGGAVDLFGGAIGKLANQIEEIADQAHDVSMLESKIKASEAPINSALDELTKSADLWHCAEVERALIASSDFSNAWTPKLSTLDIERRRTIAGQWIVLQRTSIPGYCSGAQKASASAGNNAPPKASETAMHSGVGDMLVAIKTANIELVDLANHKYTPMQRKAIVEATLSRLGAALSRAATLVTLF